MKAMQLREVGQPLEIIERQAPTPSEGQVVVELRAAALNRRDYWITRGKYPGIKLPCVLGSDGAGIVSGVGGGVDEAWLGREVVINPGLGWGGRREAQGPDFQALGMPRDGTFATHVVVPAKNIRDKPNHLDWSQGAALPLAGLTAYRAVFVQGGLELNELVLITGIGGGVAAAALQFAVAAGAKVVVTSSSAAKIERAVSLGAVAGYDYTGEDWADRLSGEHGLPDLVVDGAGGNGYNDLIKLARPGGRIVSYGATAGGPERLDISRVFWKQLRLVGSTLGSPQDCGDMLSFVEQHRLAPIVDDVLPLAEANAALDRMKTSSQFGKIVLRIDDA